MAEYARRLQYEVCALVFHDNRGERIIELNVLGKRGLYTRRRVGSWRGIGCPADLVDLAAALLGETLEEHLITRYGSQGEFDFGPRSRGDDSPGGQ